MRDKGLGLRYVGRLAHTYLIDPDELQTAVRVSDRSTQASLDADTRREMRILQSRPTHLSVHCTCDIASTTSQTNLPIALAVRFRTRNEIYGRVVVRHV